MSEILQEQLSAFLDGELDADEAELLVRRVSTDSTLRAAASRYCLIGSVLRGERVATAALSQRVAELVEDEATLQVEPALGDTIFGRGRLVKTIAGGLIAASVAVVALLGIRAPAGVDAPGNVTTAAQNFPLTGAIAVDDARYTVPAPSTASGPTVINDTRLVNYLLRHGRVAPSVGRSDMNTRIISVGITSGDAPETNEDEERRKATNDLSDR